MAVPLHIQRGIDEVAANPSNPSACANCDEFKEGKTGFVAVFIELISLTGHTAVFVGTVDEEDRILYDPCGSYFKPGLNYRQDIMSAEEFDFNDYYKYHSEGIPNPKIHVYSFRITEDEENEIRNRILNSESNSSGCIMDCANQTIRVLDGIGPFKDLGEMGLIPTITPAGLDRDMRTIVRRERERMAQKTKGAK